MVDRVLTMRKTADVLVIFLQDFPQVGTDKISLGLLGQCAINNTNRKKAKLRRSLEHSSRPQCQERGRRV